MRWVDGRLAAIAIALLSGCGRVAGDQDQDAAIDAGPREDDMPSLVAEAFCTGLDRCCMLAGYSRSKTDCVAEQAARFREGAAVARAGGGVFDPEAGRRCLEELRYSTSECTVEKEWLTARPHCPFVYRGMTKPPGAECTGGWPSDCGVTADGADCIVYPGGDGRARCRTLSIVAEGGACSETALTYAACATGLTCRDAGCVPRPRLGEPCTASAGDDCAVGTVCDFDGTRRCVAAPPLGTPCDELHPYQCEGFYCPKGGCARYVQFAHGGTCE